MTIEELVCQIVLAKKAYYKDSDPLMSDFNYDKLETELRKLDENHPILYAVGYDSSYDWWLTHYQYKEKEKEPIFISSLIG